MSRKISGSEGGSCRELPSAAGRTASDPCASGLAPPQALGSLPALLQKPTILPFQLHPATHALASASARPCPWALEHPDSLCSTHDAPERLGSRAVLPCCGETTSDPAQESRPHLQASAPSFCPSFWGSVTLEPRPIETPEVADQAWRGNEASPPHCRPATAQIDPVPSTARPHVLVSNSREIAPPQQHSCHVLASRLCTEVSAVGKASVFSS
mmetsp:Transcript_39739/g.81376  ORF Transcript_39739/g.81376 Transcript_39739/m.81376 type:complete len:213 (-) Transcript_39739:4674-5312(-)